MCPSGLPTQGHPHPTPSDMATHLGHSGAARCLGGRQPPSKGLNPTQKAEILEAEWKGEHGSWCPTQGLGRAGLLVLPGKDHQSSGLQILGR